MSPRVLHSSPSLALAVALGALALAGCGESAPATAGASANAGSAPATTAAATDAGASATTTTTGANASASTTASGAPTGVSAKHGGGTSGSAAAATGAGATGSGTPEPNGSGGGSAGGAGSKQVGGSPKSGQRKPAGTKAGAGGAGTDSSAPPAGASSPSASTGVPYEVSTISMRPNYEPETKVFYDPTRTQPQVGDVILFYLPTGATEGECRKVATGGAPCDISMPGLTKLLAMKRVVGLPGDTIEIHDGHVLRNGQPEPEPATLACKEEEEGCNFTKPVVVPAGYYYVMGDNRRLPQEDSRVFGAIPQEAIVGTVEVN